MQDARLDEAREQLRTARKARGETLGGFPLRGSTFALLMAFLIFPMARLYHSYNGRRAVLKQYFRGYFILCCKGMGDPIDPGPHLGPPWPSRAGRCPGRCVGDEVGAAQLTARSGCQTENAQLRKTSTGSWPGLTRAQGKGHRLRGSGEQKQDRCGERHAGRHPALGRTDVSTAGLVSGPPLEPTALGGGKRLVIGQD